MSEEREEYITDKQPEPMQPGANEALALWREWFAKSGGDPFYASEMGDVYCFFCGEWQLDTDKPAHETDCIYIRAKRLVGGD